VGETGAVATEPPPSRIAPAVTSAWRGQAWSTLAMASRSAAVTDNAYLCFTLICLAT